MTFCKGCDGNHPENLCWNCKHAVPNCDDRGCSWSISAEPVAGWDAEPSGHIEDGYYIKHCPLFEEG